jgi:hypothetical protein
MSGTSLDGVDVALIDTDSERFAGFGPTGYRPLLRRQTRPAAAAGDGGNRGCRGLVLTVDRSAAFRLSRRANAQRFAYYFSNDNRNAEAAERWGSGAALARGVRFDFRFFFRNAAQNPGSNSR